jgi:hypothetical protein
VLPPCRRRRRRVDRRGWSRGRPGRRIDRGRPGSHRLLLRAWRPFTLAYRLYEWKKGVDTDRPAIAAKLEELAERGGVGLTPHQIALDRALAAVAAVTGAIDRMGATGELQDLKAAFKAARKVDPTIKYGDYLEALKAAMLEELVTAG